MPTAHEIFFVKLDALQPSQLYINAEKLAAVMDNLESEASPLRPLPVRKGHDGWVLTDGHTRAVAAHLRGMDEVPAEYDRDDLDWEAYEICVDWCLREGIRTVSDLARRTVTAEDYDRLWLQRCAAMHRALEVHRMGRHPDRHRAS